jgi:uncharacterized protein YdeI (YjbR/CyaY-like superfamily)
MPPLFFATPADLRVWFATHAPAQQELLVGYYKKGSGKPSVTWPESVDEALCVGWIDSIGHSIDTDSYMIRFTPRKPRSTWSAVNIKRVQALINEGRMTPTGLAAFEARTDERSAIYAHEQRHSATLTPVEEKQFKANQAAWTWFQTKAPSYQKAALYWVVSAKRDETRQKRLATLIDDSAHGRTIAPLTRTPKSG